MIIAAQGAVVGRQRTVGQLAPQLAMRCLYSEALLHGPYYYSLTRNNILSDKLMFLQQYILISALTVKKKLFGDMKGTLCRKQHE